MVPRQSWGAEYRDGQSDALVQQECGGEVDEDKPEGRDGIAAIRDLESGDQRIERGHGHPVSQTAFPRKDIQEPRNEARQKIARIAVAISARRLSVARNRAGGQGNAEAQGLQELHDIEDDVFSGFFGWTPRTRARSRIAPIAGRCRCGLTLRPRL